MTIQIDPREAMARMLTHAASIRSSATRGGPQMKVRLELQASAYEHSAAIVYGGEWGVSDEGFIAFKKRVDAALTEFAGERSLYFANENDAMRIAIAAATSETTYAQVEAQMIGRPDGWYVFNAEGVLQAGSFDEEEDADAEKVGYDGWWVGQLDEGTLDFSYSPDNITGV